MNTLVFAIFTALPCLSVALSPSSDSCAKTCAIHAECGIGGLCDKGQCHYDNSFCANERWSVNSRGETNNCDAYRCSPETGLCLRQAKTSEDCLSGFVFDSKKACLPSVQCNLGDPACQDLYERWKKARAEYEATTPEPKIPLLTCISCVDSATCGTGNMCWQGRCEPNKAFCTMSGEGDHYSVFPGSRPPESCGNYVCEKVSGQCLHDCLKNSDCRYGKMCVTGHCL